MRYADNHLAAALRASSDGRADQVFAARPMGGADVSYEELFARAERIAAALIRAGVIPGDRVAAQVAKSLEALELYLGTVLAGGVFLPLNPAYTDAEIAYFLTDAEPRVLVTDPARASTAETLARAAGVRAVFTLDAEGAGGLIQAAAAEAPLGEAVPRAAEDLAAMLYTSGTTGRAKGAMLSARALASNSAALREAWRFTADDDLIHALPIFHTHGLFVATNITLIAGGRLTFLPRFDPDAALEAMGRATAMMGVPTFYTRLLAHPGLTRERAEGMRLFVSGSAPLLPETHAEWETRTGHRILERYGMTECNMNATNPYEGERRPGAVGFPLPGVEIRVADPGTGAELAQGEIGMIEVRGPNLFSGYWRMPEKTAEDMRADGFFITGDLGAVDEDGYLAIVGRSKDLIISGGFNVYPREVEAEIDAAPGVGESAVIGVPHPDFGEGVVAVVARAPGAAPPAEAIAAAIAGRLAAYKRPKRIEMVDALPRNAMGKVQKKVLRERFARLFTG